MSGSGMFVLELSFAPDDAERLAARPAHRERLAALKADGVVVLAGPFADDSGALVVLDVPDRAAAEAVVAEDPYYSLGGVEVVYLRHWQPLPL
jgi:uncharacterized protein YciI